MDLNDYKLRYKDEQDFDAICIAMTEDGLRQALDEFQPVDEEITKLRGKWEAYHLLAYARFVKKKVGAETLEAIYEKYELTPKAIQSIPTYRGHATPEKQIKAFDSFAEAQNMSRLHVLIDFLEFCAKGVNGQPLPISHYKYEQEKLLAAIEDKKAYLTTIDAELAARGRLAKPNDGKFTGLGISWHTGNNPHEPPVCRIEPCFADKKLRTPNTFDNRDLEQPSTILGWSSNLTDFVGQQAELDHLTTWLNSDEQTSFQIITGDGGSGKTRLAFHFAEEIAHGLGWATGQATSDLNGHWFWGKKGMLLIIDYPEERKTTVKQFLKAVYEMDSLPYQKNLRVMLLSRDRDFLDFVEEEAPRLSNKPIHLSGLTEQNEQWLLVENSWDALHRLKQQTVTPLNPYDGFESLKLNPDEFNQWLEKAAINKTPLMIISLVYYLFTEPTAVNKSILELTAHNIIRYMTKREIRFIRKEVSEYFGLKKPDYSEDTINLMFVIRATAAINLGWNNSNFKLFDGLVSSSSDMLNIDELIELSFFYDDRLQPIVPDMLAADFLLYCLTTYAKDNMATWLIFAIGLTDYRETTRSELGLDKDPMYLAIMQDNLIYTRNDTDRMLENFSHLNRLLRDAKESLGLDIGFLLEIFQKEVLENEVYTAWVADILPQYVAETIFYDLSIRALQAELIMPMSRLSKAKTYLSLSNYTRNNDMRVAASYCSSAVDILYSLVKENPSLYAPEFVKSLGLLGDLNREMGQLKEAEELTLLSIQSYDTAIEDNINVNVNDQINNYCQMAIIYQQMAKFDEALLYVDMGLNLLESSDKDKESVSFAGLYMTKADILLHKKEYQRSLKYALKALPIYEKNVEYYGFENNEDYAVCLLNSARSYAGVQNYQQAFNANAKALVIFSKLKLQGLAEFEADVALCFQNNASYLLALNSIDSSFESANAALTIYFKLIKVNFSAHRVDFLRSFLGLRFYLDIPFINVVAQSRLLDAIEELILILKYQSAKEVCLTSTMFIEYAKSIYMDYSRSSDNIALEQILICKSLEIFALKEKEAGTNKWYVAESYFKYCLNVHMTASLFAKTHEIYMSLFLAGHRGMFEKYCVLLRSINSRAIEKHDHEIARLSESFLIQCQEI